MGMRLLGQAVRRVAGHFSSQKDERGEEDFSLFRLVRAFTRAADIMAEENHFLQAENTFAAVALLPEKTAAIETLAGLVAGARKEGVRGEHLPATLRQAHGRFADIAAQNRILLQQALVTQEAVMKVLLDSAMEESRHGYGRTGEAGQDISRATLSLDDHA